MDNVYELHAITRIGSRGGVCGLDNLCMDLLNSQKETKRQKLV
jgi:hypothetical protein